MTKTIEDVAVRFQDADLDVALTAIAPLSYNSFWQLEKDAKTPSLETIDNIIDKIAQKIKNALPSASSSSFPTIEKVVAPTLTEDGYILVSDTKDAATGQAKILLSDDVIEPLVKAINDGLKLDELNDALQNVTQKYDLGATVDNVAGQFKSGIERVANAIVNALKKHSLTRAVSPCILFKTTEGVFRLASGTTVKPGVMQINMTSPTEELIVPPYEKYIAVADADGKITQSATVPGNTQLWNLDLTKAGDYTVILSCVDYYGYVVSKKYTVHVEE